MATQTLANLRASSIKRVSDDELTVQIGAQVLRFKAKGPSKSGKSVSYFPVEDPSGRALELTTEKGERVQLSIRANLFTD